MMKKCMLVGLLMLMAILYGAACLAEAPQETPDALLAIDYGTSTLFTREEMDAAIALIRTQFEGFAGAQMRSLRYAGDVCCSAENIAWMDELDEGAAHDACMEFLCDFYSEGNEVLEADTTYTDYQWWLGRTADGRWKLLTWGY